MDLALEEAAARLGKSLRQLRYLIKQKKLNARKVAGRWVIDSQDLPLSPAQGQAVERKQQAFRQAVEEALTPGGGRGAQALRYSIRNLKAFQVALPIYRTAFERLGPDHTATGALRLVLEHLTRGCHRFDREDKAVAYRAARDEASRAVCELLLGAAEPMDAMVHAIEQDLMGALAGLLRRVDRHRLHH